MNVKTFRAFCVLTALAGCTGCGKKQSAATKTAPVAQVSIQVETSPVQIGSISSTAFVTGSLTALNDVTVGVKAAGPLTGVYKREGDPVTAGEVVAQQDTADLTAKLEQQLALTAQEQAGVTSAQAKLLQAQTAYKNDLTTLQITRSQTSSSVQQAKAAYNSAQQQLVLTIKGARSQQRKEAQAQVVSAKASLKNAQDNLHRYEELYRENAVSAQDLDQAQTAFDTANAAYNSALQAYDLLQAGPRAEEVQQARDAVAQSRQQLLTAQANTAQVQLRQEDVRSAQQDIQAAKAALLQAQAGLQQAQAAADYARQQLKDTTITSPLTGVVAKRLAQSGQQMAAGAGVLEIVSLQNIYFDAQLPESQFEKVALGMPVQVHVDALPGRVFTGRVARLFPVASQGARSFTVRIYMPSNITLLRPQMFARGTIILATHSNTMLVPRQALLNTQGSKAEAYVVSNNVAHKRKVTLGFSQSDTFEVTSGLKPGEKVITTGAAEVQDGSHVEITSASSESGS